MVTPAAAAAALPGSPNFFAGFCELGVSWQSLESQDMKKWLSMPTSLTGVYITGTDPVFHASKVRLHTAHRTQHARSAHYAHRVGSVARVGGQGRWPGWALAFKHKSDDVCSSCGQSFHSSAGPPALCIQLQAGSRRGGGGATYDVHSRRPMTNGLVTLTCEGAPLVSCRSCSQATC